MTAYTPNLPALITALPSDHTRAPQTEFTRSRQVSFLENLSITGSVRSAASAAGVSHQTAYRARRAGSAFRVAWDAALVVARVVVADTVGCRAIDGVEEKVFYHGEEVATRTRYSDRLLLAHLARLDRLAETPLSHAFADDFEEALAGFGRGEAFVAPQVGAQSHEAPASAGTHRGLDTCFPAEVGSSLDHPDTPDKFSPVPCNTRSMSYTPRPDWDEVAEDMENDRPVNAPPLEALGDPVTVLACQRDAWETGEDEWWMVGAGWRRFERAPDGGWAPEPKEIAASPEGEAEAVEPVAAPVAAKARAPRKAAKALKNAGGRSARKGKGGRKPAREFAPATGDWREGPSIRSL